MGNYEFFINNLADLFEKYGHRFLVIKNGAVLGAYSSFDDAYTETIKTEKLGTFLIQECASDPKELIQSFQGNVAFVM